MNDYRKKKQLLEENKDMYISEFDKTLGYDALSKIVDAKKDYAKAAKADDKEGMTKANNIANAVRAKYGNYTGGEFGDEYHPFVYADKTSGKYTSKYEDELDSLYDSIRNHESEFVYNYEDDPVYKAYKEVYDRQGDLAYERALSENSLKTSGVQNSNARTAAMQALGYYNSQLAAKIPELYEAAYKRHYDEQTGKLDLLRDSYDLISQREKRDYDRYSDEIADQRDIRNFAYDRSRDMLDRAYSEEESNAKREFELLMTELDNNYKEKADKQDFLYDLIRDSVEDEKWKRTHNLNSFKAGYPAYYGNIGSGNVLDYARTLFGNSSLTMEDIYNLLGLN